MRHLQVISLHGFKGSPDLDFHRYLQSELQKIGYRVEIPELPHTEKPQEQEQISFVLEKYKIDENTVIVAHSLGCAVAMKILMQTKTRIAGLILVAPVMEPAFSPSSRAHLAYWKGFNFNYNYGLVRELAKCRIIMSDLNEKDLRGKYCSFLSKKLSARLIEIVASRKHITGFQEPHVLAVVKKVLVELSA